MESIAPSPPTLKSLKHDDIIECILKSVEEKQYYGGGFDFDQRKWLNDVTNNGLDEYGDLDQNPVIKWDNPQSVSFAILHLAAAGRTLNVRKLEEEGIDDFIGTHFPKFKNNLSYQPYPKNYNMSLHTEFNIPQSNADFLCSYWRPDHCDPDNWNYKPSTYGVKGVELVDNPAMKLFRELTGNWINPGRAYGIDLGKCQEIEDDIRENGINTKEGSMIYWDVDDNSKINTYHREHVASQLDIPGWMGQGVRFDNEAAKIRFACKSNNRKQLTHNNTSGNDVETSVRKVLELENTFTREAIKDEVEDLGWHLSSTTRDKIINKLLVEFTVSGKTESGERYTPHNADTIERLLKEIDDPWVEDYWTNDEQTTLAIHMANFESRVGSLLSSSASARTNHSALNFIFSVTVPKGKETLDSKREKVFSTFIPSVEDRIMTTMGLGEIHRDMFPWNHPDAEHRFVAQDNNKEKPDVLIKIKNRSYN